ncbi:MAG: SDR family oxidoreductase [Lentisphaerae bacterium]|nr:MAG: SDR family oxidoreductase [Lentisphaerota bacterium]
MQLPFQVDLTDTVAAVTGGTGILCSEMAKALAAAGAKVAVLGRNMTKGEAIVDEIRKAGGTAIACPCDVLNIGSIQNAYSTIRDAFGPVNLLVNGAGGNHPDGTAAKETARPEDIGEGTFFELDPESVRFVMDLNYQSVVLTTQVFAKEMARSGKGNIINISSMSAFLPLTKVMSYSSAKAALNNLTAWLAVHLAPCGVRVNAIAPGFFLTTQNRGLLLDSEGKPSPRCQKILSQTPMNRLGEPQELLGALLYLASDQASGFVTGIVLPVDGGFSAYSGV